MSDDIELRSARNWGEVREAAIGAGRAFPGRTPEEPFFFARTVDAPSLPLENTLLLRADGETISQLQVYERQMNLGGARAWIGAIGNVYTLPEFQGKGHGRRLLEYAREFLTDHGYALSVLRAGEGVREFYRASGWRPVTFDRHRIADPESIAVSDGGNFDPFEDSDLDELVDLYRTTRTTATGSLYRPRVHWTDWILDSDVEIIENRHRIQLYRPDGDVEGYLVWNDSDGEATLMEVGYTGDDEREFLRACLQFLVDHGTDAVSWHPPGVRAVVDDPDALETTTRAGEMVQVHTPTDVSRLTLGAVADTGGLVDYLERAEFYWSNLDSF